MARQLEELGTSKNYMSIEVLQNCVFKLHGCMLHELFFIFIMNCFFIFIMNTPNNLLLNLNKFPLQLYLFFIMNHTSLMYFT